MKGRGRGVEGELRCMDVGEGGGVGVEMMEMEELEGGIGKIWER